MQEARRLKSSSALEALNVTWSQERQQALSLLHELQSSRTLAPDAGSPSTLGSSGFKSLMKVSTVK